MKKRNFVILIVLLGGLTTWFILKNTKSGTSDKDKTAFAVENVEEIDKIFLTNKQDGNLLLEKKNGIWLVNGKFEANKPTVTFLLNETIKKIRVRGPVPAPARDNVIANMATLATKVEIYMNGELEKVYYVGAPTSDLSGTYMYLQDSKDPYITHIPGFDGFLSSRYPVAENDWISKLVFDYKPEEIKSVDVDYPANITESFTVSRKNEKGDFEISASESAPAGNVNYGAVKSYFAMFGNKTCEGFAMFEASKFDSLIRSKPICTITLTDNKGTIHKLKVYFRASNERDHALYDNDGKPLTYDPSRYNAILDNQKRVLILQDIVFNSIMIKYSDFFFKQSID